MGISETTLDLAGHHLVTSGGMCLGVGTSLIKQLNVGTIGILVPSLAELQSDKGNDPLLLVTRPQKRARLHDRRQHGGVAGADDRHSQHLEVDFYAFLYERYVRAFTLDLTMNVGVNLEFEQMPGMPARDQAELVGISSSEVTVKVLNSQFVARDAAAPRDGAAVGVRPRDAAPRQPARRSRCRRSPASRSTTCRSRRSRRRRTTSSRSTRRSARAALMRTLAQTRPVHGAARSPRWMRLAAGARAAEHGHAHAAQRRSRPSPQTSATRCCTSRGGALPSVTFDVDRRDERGSRARVELEPQRRLWRPYTSATPARDQRPRVRVAGQVRDRPQVARQGRLPHRRPRRSATPVVIDSVGPNIFPDKADVGRRSTECPGVGRRLRSRRRGRVRQGRR